LCVINITLVADGVCLNREGELFTWGKGHRGQLGNDIIEGESDTATPIIKSLNLHKMESIKSKPIYERLGTISQISSGMIHSAAMDSDNHVYVWGKHVIPLPPDESASRTKVASDARLPVRVVGIPEHLQVIQIACGSHHTSMLLEDGSVWAIGVTTDTKRPQHRPIRLIEAGVIEMPVRQFAAHMDRTTIVGSSGLQVLQVQLWEDEISQEYAVFTPAWLDVLIENEPNIRIREVHRSWLHTVIVTEKH
jgi:alpha-tubulin suppressor-like RCC1 family protein